MKIAIIILCTCVFSLSTISFSQGQSAVPFLLISPDAVSNGMGETSVSTERDNPLALLTNPAHLGVFSRLNYFSSGYDHSDWLPQFQQSDMTFKVFGFFGGINLQNQFGFGPELSVGLGYSRIRLNLGEFFETSPDGPDVLSTFNAFETADHYSIGAGFYSWVNISAGFTLKQINSHLAPFNVQGQDRKGEASLSTYDFGFLVTVPIMDIVDRLTEAPLTIIPNVSPVFNWNLGLAKNNLGDKMVVYIDPDQADPLPRTARIGVGIDVGVDYEKDDISWRSISFKWTREANDLLVRRFPAPTNDVGMIIGDPPPPEYRSGLGDIHFFNDVILGKTNPEVIKKTGWDLTFFEFVSIRGGRFLEGVDYGNRRFRTSGFGIRLAGLAKFLRVIDVVTGKNDLFGYLLNHVDIRYNTSELRTDELNHPLSGTEFHSWSLMITQ